MSLPRIHPTSVIEPGAVLGDDVVVGPFCFLGPGVELGAGTRLHSHVSLFGSTILGERNELWPHTTLGGAPQDRSYGGEATQLVIGDDNVFREQVTVHRGTDKGGGVTRLGSRCLLMVGSHVAHDCALGDGVILTNATTLGGHVQVGPGVVCGGQVAVAPLVRLGRSSFLAGGARVERDVPPFVIVAGDRARVRGLNLVGLERAGVGAESRQNLKRAFRLIWRDKRPRSSGIREAREQLAGDPFVDELLAFLEGRFSGVDSEGLA